MNFSELNLPEEILSAISKLGYKEPSPIQEKTIPSLLAGKDVLGQAQTGTGKTAAFALPVLARLNSEESMKKKEPQVIVLAPTRELAIQVAKAFEDFATDMPHIKVLCIYGGQSYETQLRGLKRNPQIIVGTPGRVMDHMRRKTLNLSKITNIILDEADEMLKMGFIDDVEWILEQTPGSQQVALFSATMPREIEKITNKFLKDPVRVAIKTKTTTANNITQKFWVSKSLRKDDGLIRFLEVEETDGVIVFVRTKTATTEVAEVLNANGIKAAAINGDMVQSSREQIINQLKKGKVDVLIATDVVARGIDIDRISHVINYDLPFDAESYTHRIGRTGRAGRDGAAISFIRGRERRSIANIERVTKFQMEEYDMPTIKQVNEKRINKFKNVVANIIEKSDLKFYQRLISEFAEEKELDLKDIAAAIMKLHQGEKPFLLEASVEPVRERSRDRDRGRGDSRDSRSRDRGDSRGRDRDRSRDRGRDERSSSRGDRDNRGGSRDRDRPRFTNDKDKLSKDRNKETTKMELYRIEVGNVHGVRPGNIVGAISNEADIESKFIGDIRIRDKFTLIELPQGMPKKVQRHLESVWVSGQQLKLKKDRESS